VTKGRRRLKNDDLLFNLNSAFDAFNDPRENYTVLLQTGWHSWASDRTYVADRMKFLGP
jgi:hypothetical protein